MNAKPLTVYVAHEPDHAAVAARLDRWPKTNIAEADYERRETLKGPQAEAMKERLRAAIVAADVFICIISQTACIDEWIEWEIGVAKSRPDRRGMVGILLDDLYAHPPAMLNAGSIFIPFKRTYLEDAVTIAAEMVNPTEDVVLED